MTATIALIGPPCVGKSTVLAPLAAQLDLPALDLDALRWDYYAEIGYDADQAERTFQAGGLLALLSYWKPFELHAVERALADHRGCVIAFGAGHSFYEDPQLFARAQRALAVCDDIVLLLPSPDPIESARLLSARLPDDDPQTPVMQQVQARMIEHPANRTLATVTVYTADQTPDQISAAVVARLHARGTSGRQLRAARRDDASVAHADERG